MSYIFCPKNREAYQVACLGVSSSDWEGLAQAAVDALQLTVAKNAYVRVRNLPWLQHINEIKERQKRGDVPKEILQADNLAFGGKFKEAARLYQKNGYSNKALAMYTDLRMFDLAQEFLKEGDSSDRKELVRKRAEWACSVHEPRAAAELLLSAGEHERAIEIVAEQGWADVYVHSFLRFFNTFLHNFFFLCNYRLYDIGRRLSQSDRNALNLVATNLRKLQSLPLAAEIYRKLGEEAQVVQLHVESRDWAEAFRLAENLPQVLQSVHSQHAQWLAESDEFVKAHEAYILAGEPNEAIKLLNSLTDCSISENRFLDASYYMWLRARQFLKSLPKDEPVTNEALVKFENLHRLSTIYYAYATIHNYLTEPFTSYSAPALFNSSRFVVNQIGADHGLPPKGISML